jgi:membrane-bound lytic murein transglycosylase D
MKKPLRALPLVLSILLAACASVPSAISRKPAIHASPVAVASRAVTPVIAPTMRPQESDLWNQLRSSFVMADCEADPSVLIWAKRYTQNPKRFESQLRAVLPRLVYVQQVAAQYDVPGEFVLLPWIESHFRPLPGRSNRPAGIWQIMPATAGAMGLRVDGHYDGRLDVPASANAVMKLLKQYHDQFHDWRVADYAYNAGEFATSKFIQKHGMPADEPVIPRWPVRNVTREHLTKLLAMACVVREPERFGVNLPTLPNEQHLVQVEIAHSMPITQAASHAGMSVDTLKNFNAAFRNDMIDVNASAYLLLPLNHAQQFRAALLNQSSSSVADDHLPSAATSDSHSPGQIVAKPVSGSRHKTHTVKRGDSLWQIAHQYSVNVSQLQRWNDLGKQALKPGQILKISSAN